VAIILYKADNFYNRSAERGVALNDPDLDIDWHTRDSTPIISEKDTGNPSLKDADNNF
jgi:dTDP-4-dehydrorhamnose 3,5-epimerase